jgi:hypothetical protein
MPRDVAPRFLVRDPEEEDEAVTKRYCDANRGGSGVGIQWAESTTTAGVIKHSTPGWGPDADRFTTKIYVQQPLKVVRFNFDLPGAGTYRVTLDTHAGWRGTDPIYAWKVIAEEVVITPEEAAVTFGADKEVYPDDGPFILTPGCYFVTLEKTGEGMVQDWDAFVFRYNVDPSAHFPVGTELWSTGPGESWGDAQETVWTCIPMRITAYKGTWVL